MVKQLVNIDYVNAAKGINHPLPINPGDTVNKQYIDDAIAQLTGVTIKTPTDIDCSTNPDYPVAAAGDSFYVTVAGLIGGASGEIVEVGDKIICKNPTGSSGGTQAAVGSDFFILQANLDLATEIQRGTVVLATQAEVDAGIEPSKVVTPATLETKINNTLSNLGYSQQIGNAADTNFNVTHNLNSPNVLVQVYETASPFEKVNVDIAKINLNTVTISFINPPTTNQYTVSVN